MDKKIKLIGRVDLKTGIAYDLKGNIIPKQSQKVVHETKEELEERLQRRRDWLRGYIGESNLPYFLSLSNIIYYYLINIFRIFLNY